MAIKVSRKQYDSLQDSNARINIWEGSVRSGKTFISLQRFIKELIYGPEGDYCFVTRTFDTFKRNILDLFEKMTGFDCHYFIGKRELKLWGKTIFLIGADDERAESKVRGSSFAGAYVDELSIIPEAVFKMLVSRCAMHGAKIFATTNPDSPYHWLKKDYLDSNPDVKSFKFILDDNPDLKPEDKEYLKRQYKGLWYQRFIQGLWVQAEGAIYDSFSEDMHVIGFPPHRAQYYILGVDYGTSNACSFVLIGVNREKYPNIWVENVYYYDSKIHQRQKTDTEYAQDLVKMIQDKYVKAIYIDPSAASFKLELVRQGVSNLYDAENEVLDGIRLVNAYLNNGTLKITRNCKALIEEIQGYVWDSKSAKLGVDKPLKQNDHACVVGETLVHTIHGNIRIDELAQLNVPGKLVNFNVAGNNFFEDEYFNATMTHPNAKIYELVLLDGTRLSATGDHRILTNKGFKPLSELTIDDYVIQYSPHHYCRVKSVKRKGEAPVYCLATKDNGNFIANGIVIKNCDALRYAMYSHFFNKAGSSLTSVELDKLWYEATGNEQSRLPSVFQQPEGCLPTF